MYNTPSQAEYCKGVWGSISPNVPLPRTEGKKE